MARYLLGNTDAEHERLIRQAIRLAPVTERFFREAGLAPGQRVLDVGAGVGDVAMVASRIVGPSGSVVGIERDGRTIARARSRAAEAGLQNIEFVQSDIDEYSDRASFDAVVGRYILQFLPDPVATLRCVAALVRPGGIVAFQEGSWAPFLQLSSHLPLWSAAVSLLRAAGVRGGANLEMGPALHRVFPTLLGGFRMRYEARSRECKKRDSTSKRSGISTRCSSGFKTRSLPPTPWSHGLGSLPLGPTIVGP
jgi:ubiquinone/menaquinone biosynthesis C-methylase UbiE